MLRLEGMEKTRRGYAQENKATVKDLDSKVGNSRVRCNKEIPEASIYVGEKPQRNPQYKMITL